MAHTRWKRETNLLLNYREATGLVGPEPSDTTKGKDAMKGNRRCPFIIQPTDLETMGRFCPPKADTGPDNRRSGAFSSHRTQLTPYGYLSSPPCLLVETFHAVIYLLNQPG